MLQLGSGDVQVLQHVAHDANSGGHDPMSCVTPQVFELARLSKL